MTTKAEIMRWVRPVIASRPDLVLEGRALLVRPVHHIARGAFFSSGRGKEWPQVGWFMDVLFAAPGSWNNDFQRLLEVGNSKADYFHDGLQQKLKDCFNHDLLPAGSISEFVDFAVGKEQRFTFLNLDRYGLEHGTVLAALGRLDEAQAILHATIADREALAAAEQRSEDEYRLTKPRPRGVIVLDVWRRSMPIVEEVRKLLAFVESRDRSAIAAVLHEWEHARVKRRQIEHLWEPTPFPIEAGD